MELEEIRTYFKKSSGLSDDTKSTDQGTYSTGSFSSLDKNRNSKGWVRAEFIVLEDDEIKDNKIQDLEDKWKEICYVKDENGVPTAPYQRQYLLYNSSQGWRICDSLCNYQSINSIDDLKLIVDGRTATAISSGLHNVSYINKFINLLIEKKNLVLTGAPGTGKTYLARQIAARLIHECTWEMLPENLKEHCGFVQFHPSYDYSDFVEGLRPLKSGGITFDRMDGVFKLFCKRAIEEPENMIELFKKKYSGKTVSIPYVASHGSFSVEVKSGEPFKVNLPNSENKQSATDIDVADSIRTGEKIGNKTYSYCIARFIMDDLGHGKPYVFIIDEINRGELSKIFGELFFAIDPGYRGLAGRVNTQYQNLVPSGDVYDKGFYIPDNVYVIGTMNDIDRGVEAMDFAIRRRFGWQEVTAEESAVNMNLSDFAKCKMEAINNALKEADLSPAFYIGGAYFRNVDDNDLAALWDNSLSGVIYEYFRGDPDAKSKHEQVQRAFESAIVQTVNNRPDSSQDSDAIDDTLTEQQ